MFTKPRLAVSSCLLGQKVRYNIDAQVQALSRGGRCFDLVGVCPEVSIGMGVPSRPSAQ